MTDPSLVQQKEALRDKARALRAKVPQADRAEAARFAAAHFFGAVAPQPGQIVACYWPIRDEIDSRPMIAELMDSRQPLCLPVVLGEDVPLEMRLWELGTALYPSGFGSLAPSETAPKVEPDILVIPLLGFDKAGTRLGYGRGYYDRTLAEMSKKPLVVGMAFAIQQLDFIPRGDHDVPLDIVVTEDGAMAFEVS